MTGALLGRTQITALITALGQRCADHGIEVEMFLVGGAAMALSHSRERRTRDLDAIFEPTTLV